MVWKNVQFLLEEKEHALLVKKKGRLSWREYLLSTLEDFDKEEWKERVIRRSAREGIDNKEDLLNIAAEEMGK